MFSFLTFQWTWHALMKLYKIIHPSFSFCDIYDEYSKGVADSMSAQGHGNTLCMMTVFFIKRPKNPIVSMMDAGMMVVRTINLLCDVVSRCWTLTNGCGDVEWMRKMCRTDTLLCKHHIMHWNGFSTTWPVLTYAFRLFESVFLSAVIILGKPTNKSSATV